MVLTMPLTIALIIPLKITQLKVLMKAQVKQITVALKARQKIKMGLQH